MSAKPKARFNWKTGALDPLPTNAAPAALVGGGGAYTAGHGSGSEALVNFNPPRGSADGELLDDRDAITGRVRDLARNNGWAQGATAKEVDAVVGASLRPISRPDAAALGITPEEAADLGKQIDARWRAYADDPRCLADTTRGQTVSQMFALAYRTYLLDGDAIGTVGWDESRPTHTTLRVIDPDLLSNPDDVPDDEFLRGGVELDKDGAAVAYHFRGAHEADHWAPENQYSWIAWDRETEWGRPQVLHHFDKNRDGQTRGISRIAAVVETLKMEGNYARVELQAAVINAVMGAFIESPFDNEAVVDMLSDGGNELAGYTDMRASYHDKRDIRLAGAKIPQLFPGEKIGMLAAARPAAQFADFESAVLRQIASAIGISYEQLASDWSKTNYSSARAALIEIWRGWHAKRIAFTSKFCQPFRMAWLEEQVDRGFVILPKNGPDFYEAWASYAKAKWIGPGRGFVDPVKEATAAVMRVAAGLSTLEDEAAELTGSDITDNLAQIQREIEAMPEGMLHPAQEAFSKLLGGALHTEPDHDRDGQTET